ncbi:bifunctional protein [Candidatus Photodesmus katoptron]|uniref:Bifunctional protein HldE n=1 Tax=Candidatus Photodesmus katoptron Akat1 TaxID=1236703 RepID=S3DJE5_9GAMM|nr:bifunctional D-glycero-beta-D-manno-heptose-7-phosphate kinase/D-glycero-beta-D-manno-heptose 1-phosphate adenylyltransferase HldE [Candidatus Photodesmus katoptron]EPE37800.1 RfaE bifunctional protein, domain I [Candidatus Photodesmus katoptron Akat1]KEY90479.1 bifunctional protein [Candidatus Photodesmus katoptron]
MKLVIPNYAQSNVLVIGDVMLDRYWYGPTNRISPEAPVPVIKVEHNEERPGGAANVAMNIASLGGNAHIIGLTGMDEPARVLTKILMSLKITCDFVTLPNYPTITKLRVLSRSQQLIRLDFENRFNDINAQLILSRMKQALSKVNSMVLSDYDKGTLDHVQQFIKKAQDKNIPIFVDPKGVDFERYRGATLLTPNMAEFSSVVGKIKSEEDLVKKGLSLMKQYSFKALLVTRSEYGMTLIRPGNKALHLPTLAKEVYDVTGAGDTVIAVLASSVASGQSIEKSCILANAAAGVVVGKLGTSTLSAVRLAEVINGNQKFKSGIITKSMLIQFVNQSRMKGEKVVMTNGCFDILHAGHVSYLNRASELGDRLVVAVNSDESVRGLKGLGRPINSVEHRMAVLAGLGAVDWVVSFDEDTPKLLISEVLPSLLVKGGDYKLEEIAGAKEVIAAGGSVKVLDFENGHSSSQIINAIQSSIS